MSAYAVRPPTIDFECLEVSATKFAKSFGQFESQAARQPIAVTSHKRVAGYFISPEDFEHYQELRKKERKAYLLGNVPERTWQALEAAEYPPGYEHLNALMDDDDNASF